MPPKLNSSVAAVVIQFDRLSVVVIRAKTAAVTLLLPHKLTPYKQLLIKPRILC